uniref:Cytochrome c oxidase assembly factor 5 n=1 Tax=Gallus gallus TaxID=9031 RepID=A0A8V0YUT3_CHICK
PPPAAAAAAPSARTAEPHAEEHQEGGVVPRPLVLGLLPVVEVPVDPLRGGEQVQHLPQRELEVHVPHVQQPPQENKSPRQCLREGHCKGLQLTFFACKRSMLDTRARFRGRKGY